MECHRERVHLRFSRGPECVIVIRLSSRNTKLISRVLSDITLMASLNPNGVHAVDMNNGSARTPHTRHDTHTHHRTRVTRYAHARHDRDVGRV
jgi:hypothetical protein